MIRCRGCGAPIDFVRNWRGLNIPVDPGPAHEGARQGWYEPALNDFRQIWRHKCLKDDEEDSKPNKRTAGQSPA